MKKTVFLRTGVEKNIIGFDLIETVKNPYPYDPKDPDNTSKADFLFIGREKRSQLCY